MLNKVQLIGRVGKIESSAHQVGDSIAKISLCTTEAYRDPKSKDWVEKEEWHRLVAFKDAANHCALKLKKGDLLYVEGKLSTSKYKPKDSDEYRYSTEIILTGFPKRLPKYFKKEGVGHQAKTESDQQPAITGEVDNFRELNF